MKLVILAAGEGRRLRPFTEDRPKCMVPFLDKPIIGYIVDAIRENGIKDIVVVDGYQKEVLRDYLSAQKVKSYFNEKFSSTNMVHSLFCAEEALNDDIIISYSDIIYKPNVLKALIDCPAPLAVTVDKDWHKLWSLRMEDPLKDAETMIINSNNHIVELGKKPQSLDQIQGQYMGLIKVSKELWPKIIQFYKSLDRTQIYDGKTFENMFMTSFLQLIIDKMKQPIYAQPIHRGWIEIDSVEDLNVYSTMKMKALD